MKSKYFFISLLAISSLCVQALDSYEKAKREIVARVDTEELRAGLQDLRAHFKMAPREKKLTLINSMITILEELQRRRRQQKRLLPRGERSLLDKLYTLRRLFPPRRS